MNSFPLIRLIALPAIPRAAIAASVLGAVLAAGGCASYPVPQMQLAASQAAIGNASAQASAPGLRDLALAREKMGLAQHLASSALPKEARWLAEQAEVDAQLAQAKMLAANATAEAARWQRSANATRARYAGMFAPENTQVAQ
jgi:hypothetical protein